MIFDAQYACHRHRRINAGNAAQILPTFERKHCRKRPTMFAIKPKSPLSLARFPLPTTRSLRNVISDWNTHSASFPMSFAAIPHFLPRPTRKWGIPHGGPARAATIGHNLYMPVPITQVDAFAAKRFGGNPAAVCVLVAEPDATWMADIAREMNLSETAFVFPVEPDCACLLYTSEARPVRRMSPGNPSRSSGQFACR